jgi:hypothetical protein
MRGPKIRLRGLSEIATNPQRSLLNNLAADRRPPSSS